MPTLGKYKYILIVVTLASLLYLGYMFWPQASEESALVNVSGGAGTVTDDFELLQLLSKIKQIKLESSIFSNPVFQTLEDFGQTIPEEYVGRANPFAPIGK